MHTAAPVRIGARISRPDARFGQGRVSPGRNSAPQASRTETARLVACIRGRSAVAAAPRSRLAPGTGGPGWRPARPGRRSAAQRRHPVPAASGVWFFGVPDVWHPGFRGLGFPEPQRYPGTPSCRRPDWADGGRSHCPAVGKQCPAVVEQRHAVAQQAPPLPGMVCRDPDRAAAWRQSIRAPRPMPAFPLPPRQP